MPVSSYEIRVCTACGLRYPLTEGHVFGIRCPACTGSTRIVLRRRLTGEPGLLRPETTLRNQNCRKKPETEFSVLLDNIRSAWNAGSILRSADGFGFLHAYICGITPTPENESVRKTSLGAEDSVTWSYHKNAVKLIKGLKKEGWKVYALEDDPRAIRISRLAKSESDAPAVLIVGNETVGVDPGLLELCDAILYIPMRGEKKSFNAAVAFSVAAYGLKFPHL